MKVLWCHSHLVSLAFILKTLCDLFLLLFCLYCCVGIVREKRGAWDAKWSGKFRGRKLSRELRGFVAIHESFLREICRGAAKARRFSPRKSYFSPIRAKVFSIESFPLYGRTFCLHKTFTIISNASKWNCKPNITLLYLGLINPHSLVEYHSPKNSVDCHHKGHIVLSRKTPLQPGFFRITFVGWMWKTSTNQTLLLFWGRGKGGIFLLKALKKSQITATVWWSAHAMRK